MNRLKVSPNYLFNLLAGDEYEYPLLQKEAVDKITKNITDIVYSTLNQKSTASSAKRCNLLHLINVTCQTPEFHTTDNSLQVYLNHYEHNVCNSTSPLTDTLLCSIKNEQQALSTVDIHTEVVKFYKRKSTKRKEFVKRLELIKQNDMEELQKVNMCFTKTVSSYETDQNLIDKLLKVADTPVEFSQVSLEVRKKQVGFLYAIVNTDSGHTRKRIINYILDQLLSYETLQKFEVKLLEDLWMNEGYTKLVVDKFPFVMEKIVIRFCQEIVKLATSSQVSEYFLSLTGNKVIKTLQKVCAENLVLYSKLKNVIFELYVHSYCNENVYRFGNYIIS